MYEIFLELLKTHNATVADVSKATGIGHSTLSTWKSRGGNLSAKHAKAIADYFGVSVEYLITGKNPAHSGLKDEEIRLLWLFGKLNKHGKEMIMEQLELYVGSPKYTEKNASHSEEAV